jgi:transposase
MSDKTKRDLDGMEARRRKGMDLLARGVLQAEVARQCGVNRVSVLRWEQQRKTHKAKAWKRRPLGRRPKLTPAHKQTLEKALEQGAQAHGFLNDLWTLPRVATLIERQSDVRLHPGHVWRVLEQMGWSLQRPSGRAVQRDPAAVARWKKHTWPTLKKRP